MSRPAEASPESPANAESAVSHALVGADALMFRYEGCCIPYVCTAKAWVAAGAPLGPPAQAAAAIAAFVEQAAQRGLRACFFAVEEGALEQVDGLKGLCIGWQGWWNPNCWGQTLATSASLRAQLRRARGKGLSIVAINPVDVAAATAPWRRPVAALVSRWLSSREMAPLRFVVQLEPSLVTWDESIHVLAAVQGENVIAVARVVALPQRQAWVLQDLLRLPNAPNGTSELLIDAVMKLGQRAQEPYQVREVSLGMVPLFGDVPRPLRIIATVTRGLFNFSGLHKFKQKLQPHRREAVFIAYPFDPGKPSAMAAGAALVDVLRAFAGGPLWCFALRTFFRGPRLALHALAWLLLPWTALLALAAPPYWFPRPWVRWAWSLFDVALTIGFFWWRSEHRRLWLRLLTFAVGVDAVATTAQIAIADLPRIHDVPHTIACGVAFVGPWLALTLLLRALHRTRAVRRSPSLRIDLPPGVTIPGGAAPRQESLV